MKAPSLFLRHSFAVFLAALVGVGAFVIVAPAQAQSDPVTICWRGRTMTVERARLVYYPGHTMGGCDTSPSYRSEW